MTTRQLREPVAAVQRVSDGAARRLAWAAMILSVIGLLTGIGLEAGLLHRTSVLGMLGKLSFLACPGAGLLLVVMLAGAVAVVLRFRRSRGVERQQMRWVAAGGSCVLGRVL